MTLLHKSDIVSKSWETIIIVFPRLEELVEIRLLLIGRFMVHHLARGLVDPKHTFTQRTFYFEKAHIFPLKTGDLDELSRGHMIADAVAIIGTMDIVFGEIDR